MENPPDMTTPPLAGESGHSRRIARSTAVFSLATAVSRVLGNIGWERYLDRGKVHFKRPTARA